MVLGLIVTMSVSNVPKTIEIYNELNNFSTLKIIEKTAFSSLETSVFWIFLPIAVIILITSTYIEYQRRTHDWILILKYQDWFDKMGAKRNSDSSKRNNAAAFLLGRSEKGRTELYDIFDLFEDMGFYLKGNQLSSKVIHHYFYHWIRIYYQKSEKLIADYCSEQPARYEHLPSLFKAISIIEAKKQKVPIQGLRLKDEKLTEYLEEELD